MSIPQQNEPAVVPGPNAGLRWWEQPAVAATMLLAAGGMPLLAGLLALFGLGIVCVALPVLGLGLVLLGTVRIRGAGVGGAAMVAGGVVMLLVSLAPLSSFAAPSDVESGVPDVAIAVTLGCVGLAGCLAARLWRRCGGPDEPASVALFGGLANLAGAGLGALAESAAGSWTEVICDNLAIWGAVPGCVLLVRAAFLMSVSIRQHAGHAAPPPPFR